MARPIIDVAITTWPNHPQRLAYFSRTMHAFANLVTASEHELRFYCSAETERDPKTSWHGDDLEELCGDLRIELQWREAPANLGANMNAAMRMGSGDLIFLQQDDWCPIEPFDLSFGAQCLLERGFAPTSVDIVRYSWPLDPSMAPTFGQCGFRHLSDIWKRFSMSGNWPYGDDPHLRRRDFMDRWKWYLEGGLHGTASADLMQTLRDGNALILAAEKVYYQHIGYASAVVGDVRSGANRRYE